MRGFALGVSLSLAFIVGCLAGPHLTTSASAQTAASPRYQYYCIGGRNSPADLTRTLNERASRGWELVTGAGMGDRYQERFVWCMRRPTGQR